MMQRQTPERPESSSLAGAWAIGALAAGLSLGLPVLLQRPVMEAAVQTPTGGTPTPDLDGDGLVDAVERILGTAVENVDTDGDGYSDAEELARRTSPTRSNATPAGRRLSLSMTVFGHGDRIHVLSALYLDGVELEEVAFHMGVLFNGTLRPFSEGLSNPETRVSVLPATDARDMVVLIDYPVLPEVIEALGAVSFYAAAGYEASGTTQTADAIDLVSKDGVVLHREPRKAEAGFLAYQPHQQAGSPSSATGVIYTPIPVSTEDGNDGVPASWTPSEICSQRSAPVGASGAVVTHEVVAADCVEDWDAFCDPSCGATVGETYQTIDPVSLVGG